jgi:hypothetical protein
MKSGKLLILLIDDAPDDVFFVQEATRRGGAGHTVYPVGGAVEAISYLKGEAVRGSASVPAAECHPERRKDAGYGRV